MKFLKTILVVLIFAFPVYAAEPQNPCYTDEPYVPLYKRYEVGLVFSVRKCGAPTSFVVGTMHADDPDIIDRVEHAFALLRSSRVAYFESLLKGDDLLQQVAASYYPIDSAETLRDAVGSEYYRNFHEILKKHFPDMSSEMVFFRMRPWAAALLLAYPKKVDNGIIMDEQFQQAAEKAKIELRGVEKGAELVSMFTDLSEQDQLDFFKYSVDNFDKQNSETKKMEEAYLSENLDNLEALANESLKEMDKEELKALKDFEKKLIFDRNIIMVERPLKDFEKGGVFMAVGALHLVGEKGVLRRLEKKGYYIDVVKPPSDNDIFQ